MIIVASKKGGQKTLFRYDFHNSSNPYDNSTTFISKDASARKAIWESDFYSEWKESYNGVLEPTNFRGRKFVRTILEIAGEKSSRNTAYFTTSDTEKKVPSTWTRMMDIRKWLESSKTEIPKFQQLI